MGYKISWFGITIFAVLLISFGFPMIAQAFDPAEYPLSTINEEYSKMEKEHGNVGKNPPQATGRNNIDIVIHPQVVFSIQATYLNQERLLSEKNLKGLEVFQKTFLPDHKRIYDVYQHEIFIRDSDGREYWLPIQETFREPFRQEYYQGCDLTLYLIFSIIYDHEPFIIINEFYVK